MLQKDPEVRRRFKETLRREEEGWNLPEEEKKDGDVGGLEGLVGGGAPPKVEGDVSLPPVQPAAKKSHGRGFLSRRKKHVDEDMEMRAVSS